jgi:hypothetical protein
MQLMTLDWDGPHTNRTHHAFNMLINSLDPSNHLLSSHNWNLENNVPDSYDKNENIMTSLKEKEGTWT